MKMVRVSVDLKNASTLPKGRVDRARLDATTEADLAAQEAEDEAEAMHDAARFVRRVRQRLGLTQRQFAQRIDVPLDTIRNWEQGRRYPTGAAKTLLKILDKAPEAALHALA
ncbi:helix-turn-helix domain-containing protein [Quisquiliibacterium transsilvanicum]|uniref:Putative transcriptional regulator n=1 Tax=Quisquiliibacterium transsilvanicum TaxID=1549638 RepID=A0A7W8HGN1_9BURK|nr:helix-turn-helix domain-containing protein [Quisquiliibacterium transsilvanicum]MBB5270908.1 putative transcriptional regulator [Quisquiliibacterium transsilvanicum]